MTSEHKEVKNTRAIKLDLELCDFLLFPLMKGQMKGKTSADVSELKKRNHCRSGTTPTLRSSRNVFSSGETCRYKCIASKGNTLKDTIVVID